MPRRAIFIRGVESEIVESCKVALQWTVRMRMVISAIVALFFFLGAASRNIAPDAVTRATIWNSHEGDPDVLGDGKVPQDADARPFTWKTKGILVFAWEEPRRLEKLRIYVGAIGNNYQVRAYLGGRLDETGTLREPEGVQTALIEENARAVNQWIEIYFPPDTTADNLELWTLGPTIFYEVEIYVHSPDVTAVERLRWGKIKADQGFLSVLREIP